MHYNTLFSIIILLVIPIFLHSSALLRVLAPSLLQEKAIIEAHNVGMELQISVFPSSRVRPRCKNDVEKTREER